MNNNLLPLTPDVRCDLWEYFGETPEDAERMSGAWPQLPTPAVDYTGSPKLCIDTPFGRAFAAWRQERRQERDREAVKTLILNGGVEGSIFVVSLTTDPPQEKL